MRNVLLCLLSVLLFEAADARPTNSNWLHFKPEIELSDEGFRGVP